MLQYNAQTQHLYNNGQVSTSGDTESLEQMLNFRVEYFRSHKITFAASSVSNSTKQKSRSLGMATWTMVPKDSRASLTFCEWMQQQNVKGKDTGVRINPDCIIAAASQTASSIETTARASAAKLNDTKVQTFVVMLMPRAHVHGSTGIERSRRA